MPPAKAGELMPRLAKDRSSKAKALAQTRNAKKARAAYMENLATFSEDSWRAFLSEISEGKKVPAALKSVSQTMGSYRAYLILEKKADSQVKEAKIRAMRQFWTDDILEEVLVNIAMGGTVKESCAGVFMEDKIPQFYSLMLRDPTMKAQYEEARMIQAEKMAIDDVIEISDNIENDETWDGRGNSAAVNRARLMVDSRKWIASKLHYARFGEKQQIDLEANIVIDHAARLDAARKRKEKTKG